MTAITKIEKWGNTHHPIVLDPVRIVLGLFLLLKGLSFMNNAYSIHSLIMSQDTLASQDSMMMAIVYGIAFVHLVGGLMIALGVATRINALIQIFIVGAKIFLTHNVHMPVTTGPVLSAIVLILLFVFAVVGSGKISIERMMSTENSLA